MRRPDGEVETLSEEHLRYLKEESFLAQQQEEAKVSDQNDFNLFFG